MSSTSLPSKLHKEMLEEGIGMESRAFVVDVLSKLRDDDHNLGSRDVDNFARGTSASSVIVN